ncbi:hypothetical protein IscW_ISCW008881 [Ixodes scapularis]|uniref:Generative cell specific-1/HAP2 domain-containing protein n=1 Tax=Ixodes scapularis TaxID=6945 RepID=B7PZS5_IXOSC|nr:hypothetical protein IscW_ISCW008881 [Ixodes scapularis]|eukprot:XP_002405942.1 hypothetical protein IscW_ISCW008881 [Ixodes scapularis]
MLTPLVCVTLLVINLFSCAAEPDVKVKVVTSNCLPLPTSRHSKTASALESFLSAKPTLTDCHRKLRIILRINNCAKASLVACFSTYKQIKNEDLYVFLDEAEDEESNATLKLLEPIVVKFHQHPVTLAHGLHYLGSVNGKLAEAVHSAPNVSSQKSIDACFSNDLSQFLCGYDGDELYPKLGSYFKVTGP